MGRFSSCLSDLFENKCGSVACQQPLAQIFIPSVVLSPAYLGGSPGSFSPYDCRLPRPMASEPVEERPLESVQFTFLKAPLTTLMGAEPRCGPLPPSHVVGPSAVHRHPLGAG